MAEASDVHRIWGLGLGEFRVKVYRTSLYSLVLRREWGNGLKGYQIRNYHRDPFSHSLLRTREYSRQTHFP